MISFKFKIEYVLLFLLIIACLPSVAAFGAGDIPDFAFLEGKAFRHGDIESILEELYKNTGKSGGFGGGLLGVAVGVASALATGGRGQKFSKSDVKRVYFGNWLRDYSQAMDIAGLSKLTAQSLVTVVSVLGFLEFGFATEEYQVTAERLGVYLPIEHIDNPKGYAEKEGDARQFHPNLRPPVDPRELEINQSNGMKNYMASENQGWDTSTALIRRTLQSCIQHARQSGGNNGPELYEAYRLLGSALHTLEDLLAHSNWCELTLLKMGHNVFCHVGDNVKVNTPNGPAPPLVTGTFGGADFLHSLLGESQDHLSESSISDLSARVAKAKEADRQQSKIDVVKGLLGKVPSGGNNDDKFQKPEEIKARAVNLDVDKVAPEEVQRQLWDALVWRDGVMRDITKIIENIPGLEDLLEQLNMALMEYVFTIIEPWLSPLLIRTTGVLKEGSAAVIDTNDQYQVWDNPNASDPSHSFLSKDHFGLALNEPAGKVAKVVVEHTVNVIVGCWWDESKNVDEAINKVLEAFHHPHYATGSSEIQNAMYETFNKWFGSLGSDQNEVINRLSPVSLCTLYSY
ncbi:hypothetical protein FRC03_000441 [Tulasnella sp. 419]|nr:hypothetical protein FRC03_000441 [Tulasnella sp. 419]